ncbi:MAG: glycine oxidase ThiO [Nitrosomonadaceae bacterium]|nr:glycine oxidase ThiO [Nitrosomonadaceae bacterium]MDW7647220.1 glycine oxidase ThiO [Nitrosomonadaceae bacterium]MDW7666044.1 glycine oxidase ThiO [Nitrosomonadaceae bacterium]
MNNREMDQDFIVIGAGIIGLATAEQLLLQGATVTLLERGEVGLESSWAGGGILSPLCPWDYPNEVTRLTNYSASLFANWMDELHTVSGIDPEYERSGMLVLPPFSMCDAQQWCTSHGVKVERASQYDALSIPRTGGGTDRECDALLLSDVAQVRNPRLLRALRKRVELLGGRIVEQCAVSHIVAGNGQVNSIATACGTFSAGQYVVAAGAWSKQVLGQHALDLDIKPARGQMLLFRFSVAPLRFILLKDDLYLIPRRDGCLLIGSTLEDVGFDKGVTAAARDNLLKGAQELLPALSGMVPVQQWSGLRPASPHNIPTIGRHPQLDNLYINSGHFRYGVTMAPASAKILLNEMTGVAQPFDVSPYQSGWGA